MTVDNVLQTLEDASPPEAAAGALSIIVAGIDVLAIIAVLFLAWRRSRPKESQRHDSYYVALLPAYVLLLNCCAVTLLGHATMEVLGTLEIIDNQVNITAEILALKGNIPGSLYYVNVNNAEFLVPNPKVEVTEALWFAAYEVSLHTLMVFLLQRGAGTIAQRRSLSFGVMVGILTAVVLNCKYLTAGFWNRNPVVGMASFIQVAWYLWLVCAYTAIAFLPGPMLYRRPAAYRFAKFCIYVWLVKAVFRGYSSIVMWRLLGFNPQEDSSQTAPIFAIVQAIFAIPYRVGPPIVLYLAMVEDSAFWQGYHSSASDTVRSSIGALTAPLDGIRYSIDNAANITNRLDDAITNSQVRMINFATLRLDGRMLGAGGQARVYIGILNGVEVAVKVMFCMELTTDVIDDFIREASFLTNLQHPNIVKVHGVCVVPPTLAIVLELCSKGSLTDVLVKPPNDLTWMQKLLFCCDCVRALAFLHERHIIHCDIKSANYLVSHEMRAKLADLGLAEKVSTKRRQTEASQRDLPELDIPQVVENPLNMMYGGASAAAAPPPAMKRASSAAIVLSRASSILQTQGKLFTSVFGDRKQAEDEDEEDEEHDAHDASSTSGFSGSVMWAAPEVLNGGKPSLASDVYSITVVLWEIVAQLLPYTMDNLDNLHPEVLSAAIRARGDWQKYMPAPDPTRRPPTTIGLRPVLPMNVPAAFADLLDQGWHHEPRMRPTIQEMLLRLERLVDTARRDPTLTSQPHRPMWQHTRFAAPAPAAHAAAATSDTTMLNPAANVLLDV